MLILNCYRKSDLTSPLLFALRAVVIPLKLLIMYLNNHSYFSLRYGTLPVETLVSQAKSYGLQTLALTDINNSMGMVDFVRECRKQGIRPVAGVEFRNGDQLLYIGLARNNKGSVN